MKKIICIGSATKDIFVVLNNAEITENKKSLTEKRLMSFEFGAKIYAKKLVEEVGGSAVNVAAGLTLAGFKGFVFSRTDKSEIGKWIQKQIGKLKLKKNYMQSKNGEQSGVSVIISDENHLDHTIFRTGDSVENFDLEKALKKFREKIDWVYIGSQKNNSQKNMKMVLDFANKKNANIIFVPSSYQIKNDLNSLQKNFSEIDFIFINRDEAIEILQNLKTKFEDKPLDLLKKIKDFGFKNVVITDGANGAYVYDGKEAYSLGINKTKKIETVGAGDAFLSGFMGSYIEKQDIKEALCWGIVNSGAVLTEIGSTKGLLKRKELQEQTKEIIKNIKKI